MKYLAEDRWWLVLPLYGVAGLAVGLADPLLGRWVQALGARPGLATAASVNILLPLLATGLAVACPRLPLAWLGAVGMAGAFAFGLALRYGQGPPWNVGALLRAIPPVLVLACLGYAVLGSIATLLTRAAWR